MNDYEQGVRHGRIEQEALVHFDVAHNGWAPQEKLHDWVKEQYDEQTAETIFPIEPSDEPYDGTVAAVEQRLDALEAGARKYGGVARDPGRGPTRGFTSSGCAGLPKVGAIVSDVRKRTLPVAARSALNEGPYARGRAVYIVECDWCGATFEGTPRDRRTAGWRKEWARVRGTGVREQIDVCPYCKDRSRRPQRRKPEGS